jgi:pimeloyl-ACP methyl ester carboxylesterase
MLANDLPAYLASYRLFATADADLPPMVQAIRCPTLVLTGAEDVGSTAAMAEALAARLADGRLAILPGLRHMAPVEAPKEVGGALLAFLGA